MESSPLPVAFFPWHIVPLLPQGGRGGGGAEDTQSQGLVFYLDHTDKHTNRLKTVGPVRSGAMHCIPVVV
jgi:hypothetical protein